MVAPPYLSPFVVDVPPRQAERDGALDLYLPSAAEPRPAILFVHGGPIPADLSPTPRGWPVYVGYGSLAAGASVVGATVDHRLYDVADYPRAHADVTAAVAAVRRHPRVDADRVALWFFSGGGLLISPWLRDPPAWLRCLAATYPLLAPLPGRPVDDLFRPVEAVRQGGDLPIVLTRVGREQPALAEGVASFVAAARAGGTRLEVIDVPDGQHGFDMLDHTAQSRLAVEAGLRAVRAALG